MVSVVVTQAFAFLGRNVYPGDWIEMEPLDAAIKSHAGLVSLSHGQRYQTRHMEAADPGLPQYTHLVYDGKIVSGSGLESASYSRAAEEPPPPPKRRRGRPRKVKA